MAMKGYVADQKSVLVFQPAPKGRARRTNIACSWFVLSIGAAMFTTVEVNIDLQTVICQVPSVSRESVAAAKLQQPADASLTIWWRQSASSGLRQATRRSPG
jgi:hypothetical protein